MAELHKGLRIKPELLEALVKTHFGAEYTSRLAWNVVRGRYVPSTVPRRIAAPQRLFGLQIGWRVVGEFSENLGFRLELWDPSLLRQAERLIEEYNTKTDGTKLELHPFFMGRRAPGLRPAA